MEMENDIRNDFAKICYHSQSLRGAVQDYIISFEENVSDIRDVIDKTYDIFELLMNKVKDNVVKARLIAQVNYLRMNDKHEEIGQEDYHFASYQAECVYDTKEFYTRHLTKIATRLDEFHQNGSRLLINRIKHIHIALTVCRSASHTNT